MKENGHSDMCECSLCVKARIIAKPAVTTGGTKHDGNKVRLELVPAFAYEAMAKVFTFGAKKYAAHNWAKGFDWSRLIGAIKRHTLAVEKGEDIDPESGEPHLAHLMCSAAMLLEHQIHGLGQDDRPTYFKKVQEGDRQDGQEDKKTNSDG